MKLKDGMTVTMGFRTWVGEIPDDKFAIITKDWPKEQVDEWKKRHAKSDAVKPVKDKDVK